MKSEQLELGAYLDNVKVELGAKTTMHLSWAKSAYHAGYELSLSEGDKGVLNSITELELASFKGDAKQLVAQKIENMINSLQFVYEDPEVAPSKPLKGLKVNPPQVDSLDELYEKADWEGIIKQDAKVKAKSKKPTAAELELKEKHQIKADWTTKLEQINKIVVKKYENEMSKEDILWPYFKAK